MIKQLHVFQMTIFIRSVLFILINDYEKERKDLEVGPLNGLINHRFGFKIYYYYNSLRDKFTSFFEYFLKIQPQH